MKICFLTHNLKQDNGLGVFSERLIKGVKDRLKCEVEILTTEYGGFSYEKPILYPGKLKLLRHFFLIRRIFKNCDVIHALDGYPYGVIAVFMSLGLGKKVIITAVGSGSIIPLYQGVNSILVKYCYLRADIVTAISAFTRDEILKKVGGLDIKVINPGVDFEEFKNYQSGHFGVLKFKPYILSVGSLRWRKGYHFSIQAYAQVIKQFPELNYVIVGKKYKEDYYQRLQKLINDLNLRDKVFILEDIDKKEDLIEIYKNAELFCLFSQNVNHDVEGFGLVFLEAAAAGLPVVGSKNCGIDDAMREDENGLLVASREAQEFAAAITKILNDEQLKKRMQEKSLMYAQESSWKKRIEEYVLIY